MIMTGQQLKNSILQEAIEGRLVPQDPNDEPASVLLERIRAEKARLVKEKKFVDRLRHDLLGQILIRILPLDAIHQRMVDVAQLGKGRKNPIRQRKELASRGLPKGVLARPKIVEYGTVDGGKPGVGTDVVQPILDQPRGLSAARDRKKPSVRLKITDRLAVLGRDRTVPRQRSVKIGDEQNPLKPSHSTYPLFPHVLPFAYLS